MTDEPIKIAILAMGGEGGGVLADWIVNLGEHNGYFAQTTSVPGVAQRTGATIYYVELFPGANVESRRVPVLAQAPLPGDVDIVLASELMEAGRAVQRGFVTTDRTTLITSTHRVYSIAEKSAMGDGRVSSPALLDQARSAAREFICFDMEKAAEKTGSVISAVLFGALSGAGVLPFNRKQFEETIELGGVGVKPSLKAFDLGFTLVREGASDQAATATKVAPNWQQARPDSLHRDVVTIIDRVCLMPEDVSEVAYEGVKRLIDYQDPAYAALYMDRLERIAQAPGGTDRGMLRELARHLALWMSFEDTIRVADLKSRGTRFDRVRGEVRSKADQVLHIQEYMHPRLDEICETLPAGFGRWLAKPHIVNRLVGRMTQSGRTVKTSALSGFLLLHGLAKWRRWRRSTLRYELEDARIEAWLERVRNLAAIDPVVALEVVQCQRLVKGYSDTHSRGLKNFEVLMAVVDRHKNVLSAPTLRELRNAALADEHGLKLKESLMQHALTVEG
ncbi:indolepyruvate oxidoreductase subunit beta family protein [Pseudomonas sp. CFBP 8770]|uniref:indolepyruvate oxidoreductase subunit beta family protein n=1 Tax=unclassified Pseudomonas TaxID=196821 RepID=UPI001786E1D1|nr:MULTISPECIES: indolepyruvate oxidoreductase subunit beta family protein [unclassified Pseudomonas]MBD8473192.1 indolepyruvate oxidoreductase subunit beta family protein [Pseudomonas sp. CFBP 8773]MBD8595922.1 indolepyruvate oxidoreductase subunit beta family protein [Pseudomonas sp. CFBP 8758]MBD8646319.1 indolepyruvate oxidoreductase subunit beta family protein [Pseudomonas sp. CFBP 8770]MBD8733539.1 indolepyruvate oxidoreductase subunit beta family protein [Pseudomonas sp. CFBP 13710]